MIELRDSVTAKQFLLEGVWWQRVKAPSPETFTQVLEWALELAGSDEELPPLGLLADIGHLVFRGNQETDHLKDSVHGLGMPREVLREYEDYVLGRFYADSSFDRGAAALCRYPGKKDQARGLAFLVTQIRQRAGFSGVLLSPSVIKSLLQRPVAELLAEGAQLLQEQGGLALLRELYEDLIQKVRMTGDLLGPEDVFELEHGTALAAFGQRIALRQTLNAAAEFSAILPRQPVHSLGRQQQVATRIVDEDMYPVGGFTSISNRGSIESLLHSQLAYMDRGDRPDLFDVKFLRDELLYYSRDENQFLRRRRTFLFVLYPDLMETRTTYKVLKFQGIVLLLGMLKAGVDRLIEWLSEDSLQFEFLFVPSKSGKALRSGESLKLEAELLEMLFREQQANGTVQIAWAGEQAVLEKCEHHGRRSLCHTILLSSHPQKLETEFALVSRLELNSPSPKIGIDDQTPQACEGEDHDLIWQRTLLQLLRSWL